MPPQLYSHSVNTNIGFSSHKCFRLLDIGHMEAELYADSGTPRVSSYLPSLGLVSFDPEEDNNIVYIDTCRDTGKSVCNTKYGG